MNEPYPHFTAIRDATPDVRSYLCSVALQQGPSLSQHGTATVLEVGSRLYVVTAAHVIREHLDGTNLLLGADVEFVPGRGTWAFSKPGAKTNPEDLVDPAVLELDPGLNTKFARKSKVRIADIDWEDQPLQVAFTICGLPSAMSRKSWSANEMLGFEALQITGQLVPVKKAGLAGLARYREDHHMLLEADQSSMVGRDGDPMRLQSVDGLPLSVPGDIGGMSGAAVWGFVKWDVDPEKWTKDSWKVVGFQHAVDRNEGLIRVTRANRLLHLLRQFPSASVVIDALY